MTRPTCPLLSPFAAYAAVLVTLLAGPAAAQTPDPPTDDLLGVRVGESPDPLEGLDAYIEQALDGEFTPGRHTVAVHAAEGYGQNVHLARLEPEANAGAVAEWMHWFHIYGLQVPAPATFVGGMHRLQEGATGYFTVDLEPGRYVFVSGFEFEDQHVMKDLTIAP